MKFAICDLRFMSRARLFAVLAFLSIAVANADTILFTGATVHTVTHGTIINGAVLIQSNKITGVYDLTNGAGMRLVVPDNATFVNLHGQHLYPCLIAVDSALGLSEIDAVRATQDAAEVGDFTPDVQSWIAVNPDSELLPVARANGIAYFEPAPEGKVVAGQSALLALDGWTWEQMLVKLPAALHVYWPDLALDTTPKERSADPAKWKSLEDQDKERRKKLRELAEFFDDARAYAKAKDAKNSTNPLQKIPAWEAMLPVMRGEVPVVIHADEIRQIRSAVNWAATNRLRAVLCGGRDAALAAGLLATNRIPVIFENVFTPPSRDTEAYDVHFTAPEFLRQAGVTVVFGAGPGGFGASMARNLPYHAAQAVAFGFPEDEALKALTLYPAQIFGVAERTGSLEAGKDATFFVCDGDILDIRANVKRLWIAGREINLDNRHARLYEKYKNRPPLK
jgi:imidazolonepropionase-like amidohydrolase